MRSTEVRVLLTWNNTRRQLLCYGIFRLPSPLRPLALLMLLIIASTSGVGEEINTKSLNCCGMQVNTSKCWTNNLACVCEDCGNRTQDHSVSYSPYRLEFCSSFPLNEILNAFLWNRTSCQEQLKILQGVDNTAYSRYKNFEGIIQRTDCGETDEAHTYSATSTCFDCLVGNLNVNLYHILLMKDVNVQ